MEANCSVFGNMIAHKQLTSIFDFKSTVWLYSVQNSKVQKPSRLNKERFSEFAVCFSYPTSPSKDTKGFNRCTNSPRIVLSA